MYSEATLPIPEFESAEEHVIFHRQQVQARLSELGIETEVLLDALNHGHNGAERASGSHAKTAAGSYRWHETLAPLRSDLGNRGWKQTDEKNAPRILSPDGKVSIMVATGNEKTGTKRTPSNATVKGIMTQLDVWNNGEPDQQVIEAVEQALAAESPVTWVLLYFYSETFNHIRAELSRPSAGGMDKGFIKKWDERIILPKIEFGTQDQLLDAQPDKTPDIDFFIGNANAV